MKRQVFVVEDDEYINADLTELLLDEGYEVHSFRNGRPAFQALKEGLRPDLVILDLMMPEVNGFEFLALVDKDPELRGLSVLLMSADLQADAKIAGLPFNAFLKKPFELEILLEAVDRLSARQALEVAS